MANVIAVEMRVKGVPGFVVVTVLKEKNLFEKFKRETEKEKLKVGWKTLVETDYLITFKKDEVVMTFSAMLLPVFE